jgi:hypothetical protein
LLYDARRKPKGLKKCRRRKKRNERGHFDLWKSGKARQKCNFSKDREAMQEKEVKISNKS